MYRVQSMAFEPKGSLGEQHCTEDLCVQGQESKATAPRPDLGFTFKYVGSGWYNYWLLLI
jgi:hypothetical protein